MDSTFAEIMKRMMGSVQLIRNPLTIQRKPLMVLCKKDVIL